MLLYNDNINLDIFSAVDQVALELSRSRPFEFTRREAEAEDKKLKDMEGEEQIRLLKKQVDENAAKIIEAEAKQKSAKDLFEGDLW